MISEMVFRVAREFRRFNILERQRLREHAKLVDRFLGSYWREVAQSAGVSYEDLGYGFHRLADGKRWTITYGGQVMLDSQVALATAGNKPLMYRLMKDWGFDCIPRYCVVHRDDFAQAQAMLGSSPLVTKPASGTGGGIGVTTHLGTARELRRGIRIAGRYGSEVLVEEQARANCYRLLYLDGRLIDAIWRRGPTVVGTGTATISKLVDRENELRISSRGLRSLWLITKDDEFRNHLRYTGRSSKSIPGAGEVVTVKNVVNQNNALENERVLHRVHPTIDEKCAEICRRANFRFIGVDLLIEDIGAPWANQSAVINDINTTPGLHHHVLTSSGSDNHRVGVALVNCLLDPGVTLYSTGSAARRSQRR